MKTLLTFKGRVCEGVGRGSKYIQLNMPQIENIVGFKPYIGTLDLEVDENLIKDIKEKCPKHLKRMLLTGEELIEAWLCPVKVSGLDEKCWLLVVENPPRKDVVELISPKKLKDKLAEQVEIEMVG